MFEYLESPDHVIAMKISGTITAEEVDKAYETVEKALKKNDRISFFAEVPEGFSFTWDGLMKDLVNAVGELGRLSRYYRAAIVTDSGWLGTLARVEGLVFSSVDVRVFSVADRDKAFAWASEEPEPVAKQPEPEASIRFIQTTNESVLAWEVDGRIREGDIKTAVDHMKPYLESERKMNALVRVRNYEGFDLSAVIDERLIRMKYKALSKFEKYAVVGPTPWMRNFFELARGLVKTEVRIFEADEETAAWDWVGAQQALLPE